MKTYLNTFLTFFVCAFIYIIPIAHAEYQIIHTQNDDNSWSASASSENGQYIVAAVNGGYIYTSTNYGATWTVRIDPGFRNWVSVASDSTGQYLAAAAIFGNYIYTSSDYGVTWTAQTGGGARSWVSIDSDATGQYLVASVGGLVNGYVYTSSDYGVTWTERTILGNQQWRSVTSDSTGQYLAGVVYGGTIYTSSDYGVTWTQRTNAGFRSWYSITSDSTGQYLAAVSQSSYIYTSSDYGVTWIEQTDSGLSGGWSSITSDATGQYLAAVQNSGYIYTSSDYGATWTERSDLGYGAYQSVSLNATAEYMIVTEAGDTFISVFRDLSLAPTYTLDVEASNGSIMLSPEAPSYIQGDQIIISATPQDGYVFESWSGDCSGTLSICIVTMDGNKTVVANFIKEETANRKGSKISTSSSSMNSPTNIEALKMLLAQLQAKLAELLAGTPAVNNNPFTRDLYVDMTGEDVKQLQILLNQKGFTINVAPNPGAPGFESTYFGTKTQEALKKFQQANNITPATGYFGPVTRQSLLGK